MNSIRLHRLRFRIWRLRSDIKMSWQEHFSPKDQRCLFLDEESGLDDEAAAKLEEDLDLTYQNYLETEPVFDPARTMVFYSADHGPTCCFLTAKHYKKQIHKAYLWAARQDITAFYTDYSTPFGLLALETLYELKHSGKSLQLYIYPGKSPRARRSYRLISETDLELIKLSLLADYSYLYSMLGPEFFQRIRRSAAHCTERGIMAPKP